MNETLLRELAEKLGTTVEHLWGVLVKQAPISAGINILTITVWIIVLIIVGFYMRRKAVQWDKDIAPVLWGMFWAFAAGAFAALCIIFGETVTALVNPEYWALKEILK